nr:carboxy terminal-processing peptidase [Mergibacter septicus]
MGKKIKLKRISNYILALLTLTINLQSWAITPTVKLSEIKTLSPTADNATETKRTTNLLSIAYYQPFTLDDQLSHKIFNRYLDFLDYNHNTFLQSDVDQMRKKYADTFDDQLKAGKLDAAFDMYNLMQERRYQRYTYALSLLEKEPNLTGNDQIEIDRSKKPFPKTVAEANQLWQERVKNDIITQRLKGKSWAEIQKKLIKRYNLALKRLTQTKADDVTQLYLNAFTRELDPHSSYLSPRKAKNFNESMNLSLEGIGATLQSEDDETVIKSLVPGAPAERSKKIQVGDKIIGVGQGEKGEIEDVVGWRLDDVVEKIKGKKGSKVRLELEAAKGGKTRIITLTRDKIRIEDSAAKLKVNTINKQKIGVLTIPSFYNGLTDDVRKLLAEAAKKKVQGLVIDLRNDGGGSLNEAIGLSGLFITDGPIVQVRDAYDRIRTHYDPDTKQVYTGPVVVLINRFSASASEIFSAALQDYDRAVIVGQNSFGKGTVQQSRPLSKFYLNEQPLGFLQYTIQKFYRIDGGSTQLKGVKPDILFPEIIDETEYGESKEDNALPWDKIPKANYKATNNVRKHIPTLEQKHLARVAKNPEFIVLNENLAERDRLRDRQYLSLNLAERQAEYDKNDAKYLKDLNARFKREGKKPLKNVDDLPKDYQAPDFILTEAENIAADLIKLEQKSN